jgi:hypothetical protein
MPRRYVHLQNGVTSLDNDGIDLPDMMATRAEAVRTIAAVLLEDNVDSFWNGHPIRLWITDGPNGSGETVLALNVSRET